MLNRTVSLQYCSLHSIGETHVASLGEWCRPLRQAGPSEPSVSPARHEFVSLRRTLNFPVCSNLSSQTLQVQTLFASYKVLLKLCGCREESSLKRVCRVFILDTTHLFSSMYPYPANGWYGPPAMPYASAGYAAPVWQHPVEPYPPYYHAGASYFVVHSYRRTHHVRSFRHSMRLTQRTTPSW